MSFNAFQKLPDIQELAREKNILNEEYSILRKREKEILQQIDDFRKKRMKVIKRMKMCPSCFTDLTKDEIDDENTYCCR